MWRYKLLLSIFSLPITLYLGWLALRHRDFCYLRERLGFTFKLKKTGGIWVHAASVGEINAVMPFMHLIVARYPIKPITLTTNTPTGALVARCQLPSDIELHYLPLDWEWSTRRFLDHVQPECVVIMETELWPNLYANCQKKDIPITIINGRVSQRSLKVPQWLRKLYSDCLNQVQAILARSESDKARFIEMGADPDRVKIIGNIKYAATYNQQIQPMDLGRPYILAASTHNDEELRLSKIWLSLPENGHLLVIAPRHPHRLTTILKQLRTLTTNIAVRSQNDTITSDTQIYLADTLGELPALIAGSELVFMGGSLVPVGGHNILEVGMLGKAVVFGPYMENFMVEAQEFLSAKAGIQIHDDHALAQCLKHLFANPMQIRELGIQGKHLVQKNADIAKRYLDEFIRLRPALNRSSF